jgi:hypothetical protein
MEFDTRASNPIHVNNIMLNVPQEEIKTFEYKPLTEHIDE